MSSKFLYLIGAAVLIVAALFLVLRPTQPTVPTPAQVKTYEIIIKDQKLVSGSETITVTEGDEVKLVVTADIKEELHLHGYDRSVEMEANVPAELAFTANLTGRFIYELEGSKTDIGAIEVQPK
jgi:FtsP/CotA-like multicopper oxidase with cupredoxin domain